MAEPRRSTRIASGAPPPPPATNAKQPSAPAPAVKPKPTKAAPKTAAAAAATSEDQPKSTKPASKAADTPAPKPKAQPAPAEPQRIPYLNPLPTPPERERPAPVLFAWGAGNDGQFGTGPEPGELNTERRSPYRNRWFEEQVAAGTFGSGKNKKGAGVEAIAAGGLHTMFIDENGVVWTCGNNDEAALGRPTAGIQVPGGKKGQVYPEEQLTTFPHPVQSLLDEEFRAVRIACGDNISGAISDQGELRVWGSFRANEGHLGFSSTTPHQALPSSPLTLPSKPGDYDKAVSLAAGTNHLLVLTTHGNIYTWGAGDSAQLGRRVLERHKIHGTVPEKAVLGTRARKAVYIASGSFHGFAIDTEGEVWGWGANQLGQTGTGRQNLGDVEVCLPKKVQGLSPEELGGGEKVVQIVGGEAHSLFLTSKGRVFACGDAYNGQLGLGDTDPAIVNRLDQASLPEPAVVYFADDPKGKDPIVRIAAGMRASMAISNGGALYAWGQGMNGELGVKDVEEDEIRTPTMVVRKEGGSWRAVDVACGGQHTLGLFAKKS